MAACVCLTAFSCALSAQQLTITEQALPTTGSQPLGILINPRGTFFVDETGANKIARIGSGGAITEYTIPTPNTDPSYGATGPDGAQWFTEASVNQIGRLDLSTGTITEFPVPNDIIAGYWYMVSAPDGALWFTEYNTGKIGRITTTGAVTEFPVPTDDPGLSGMTVGPDNAVWFTEEDASKIGRITTAGVITEFTIPTPDSSPLDIVPGPDRALWFTEHDGHKIGRITTAGVFTEFPIPSQGGSAIITVGPDAALWFTENDWNRIGRITTSGKITEYTLPNLKSGPSGISPGLNGTISFTETLGGKVATATACGLGLSAGYSQGKLSLSFELGVTKPATWIAQLITASGSKNLFSKSIPPLVPPQPFNFSITPPVPLSGSVEVQSALTDNSGALICSENQQFQVAN